MDHPDFTVVSLSRSQKITSGETLPCFLYPGTARRILSRKQSVEISASTKKKGRQCFLGTINILSILFPSLQGELHWDQKQTKGQR